MGFAINITSTILIMLSVDETLPAEKLRSPKYIIPDAIQYLVDVSKNIRGGANNTEYQRVSSVTAEEVSNDNNSEADSIEEDLKIIGSHFGETGDCVLMATPESRASFTAALHRPSSVQPTSTTIESIDEGNERQNSIISMISHSPMSLMQNDRVRECIWLYWITTFASTAQGECFPLFAMARTGGLGIEETSIGLINSGSGLLFVICQYFIFALSMKKFGLHKTMWSSCLLSVPPVLLIPMALLIKSQTVMIVYLSIVNGIMLIAFSNWNAALTIAQNRAVDAHNRAKLNALAALGASLSRGGGPIFAGWLVTFSYTSGIVPTQYGSVVVYTVVFALGLFAFILNTRIEDEDKMQRISK